MYVCTYTCNTTLYIYVRMHVDISLPFHFAGVSLLKHTKHTSVKPTSSMQVSSSNPSKLDSLHRRPLHRLRNKDGNVLASEKRDQKDQKVQYIVDISYYSVYVCFFLYMFASFCICLLLSVYVCFCVLCTFKVDFCSWLTSLLLHLNIINTHIITVI